MTKFASGWLNRIATVPLAVVLGATFASAAYADTWKIDPMHTTVEFSVRHMTISNVKGKFEKVSGSIHINGTDISSAVIEATIDASSINSGVEMRDADLKGPHFLDVAQFPTITFKSTKIDRASEKMWRVNGNLTMHGVTKPVSLFVDGPTPMVTDPRGNTRIGANATGTLSRKAFGLTYNPMLEAGGAVVGDAVAIIIEVEAVKEK